MFPSSYSTSVEVNLCKLQRSINSIFLHLDSTVRVQSKIAESIEAGESGGMDEISTGRR